MFALRITDDKAAVQSVQTGWPTHVICATVGKAPTYGDASILHVVMDDVIRPAPGVIVPTPEHVRQVLEFTRNLTSADRLLVYCHRGLNRSPALAIAILLQHGLSSAEAYCMVAKMRPSLAPNRLLISYIDWQFALNGALAEIGFGTRRLP